MPAERLSIRKVRDVLRLKHTLGMSLRQISEATGVGKTVVGEYVRRAGVLLETVGMQTVTRILRPWVGQDSSDFVGQDDTSGALGLAGPDRFGCSPVLRNGAL